MTVPPARPATAWVLRHWHCRRRWMPPVQCATVRVRRAGRRRGRTCTRRDSAADTTGQAAALSIIPMPTTADRASCVGHVAWDLPVAASEPAPASSDRLLGRNVGAPVWTGSVSRLHAPSLPVQQLRPLHEPLELTLDELYRGTASRRPQAVKAALYSTFPVTWLLTISHATVRSVRSARGAMHVPQLLVAAQRA